MGARESLNGRKNMARRKVKNGEKSPFWFLTGARKLLCFSAQSENTDNVCRFGKCKFNNTFHTITLAESFTTTSHSFKYDYGAVQRTFLFTKVPHFVVYIGGHLTTIKPLPYSWRRFIGGKMVWGRGDKVPKR